MSPLVVMYLIIICITNVESNIKYSYVEGNTCYFERRTAWTALIGNLLCNNQYPNCIIICSTEINSCGHSSNTIYITYPSNSCIINCYTVEYLYIYIYISLIIIFVNKILSISKHHVEILILLR